MNNTLFLRYCGMILRNDPHTKIHMTNETYEKFVQWVNDAKKNTQ